MRLNDALEELLDKSMKETEDSKHVIQGVYRVFGRLREYLEKVDKGFVEWRGYYVSMDSIYVMPEGSIIVLLWADEQINHTLGYGIWKMIYEWYVDRILLSDLYHGLLQIKTIYSYLKMEDEDIYRYKAMENKLNEKNRN